MKMKNSIFILGFFLSVVLSGCSSSVEESEGFSDEKMQSLSEQRTKSKYLAYEHYVSVDMPNEKIKTTYQTIISSCASDETHQCTILHSSINSANYITGNIRLRIRPAGVSLIVDIASKDGDISSQSTNVEDLGDEIVDNEKRLDMLKKYQQRLEALEQKPEQNIESLIKVASELSSVQADLEYAEGKKAKLLQRVQMDIVNISLFSRSRISFWQPISEALDDFGGNLSEGISGAITAIAFLIPWVFIIIFFGWLIRFFWRRSKTEAKKS